MNLKPDLVFAYYQGKWVYVPLLHALEEALSDEDSPLDTELQRHVNTVKDYIRSLIEEIINLDELSEIEIRRLCKDNDIPLRWVTNHFSELLPRDRTKQRLDNRSKRKLKVLDEITYNKFIKALSCVDKKALVIAKILWHINNKCRGAIDFNTGKSVNANVPFITLEEVLRLNLDDIGVFDNGHIFIQSKRRSCFYRRDATIVLPDSIGRSLWREISSNSWFIFANRKGGPLHAQNIDKIFKEAGKAAGIKEPVTSLSLRPFIDHLDRDISVEEWNLLCAKVPQLQSELGSPRIHDARDVFNAILYLERSGSSFRKLPTSYPPTKAVASQKGRWKKNGIYKAVLEARQSIFSNSTNKNE
ncbi:MAG: Transposase domain protein [Chlamydiales bacterium]|jgi:hypothetical protein|nr:Transposase domain protein [Chlamydiales bacterium]